MEIEQKIELFIKINYLYFNYSDENTAVNHSGGLTTVSQVSGNENYGWRMPHSESSMDAESLCMTNAVLSDSGYAHPSRRSSVSD